MHWAAFVIMMVSLAVAPNRCESISNIQADYTVIMVWYELCNIIRIMLQDIWRVHCESKYDQYLTFIITVCRSGVHQCNATTVLSIPLNHIMPARIMAMTANHWGPLPYKWLTTGYDTMTQIEQESDHNYTDMFDIKSQDLKSISLKNNEIILLIHHLNLVPDIWLRQVSVFLLEVNPRLSNFSWVYLWHNFEHIQNMSKGRTQIWPWPHKRDPIFCPYRWAMRWEHFRQNSPCNNKIWTALL